MCERSTISCTSISIACDVLIHCFFAFLFFYNDHIPSLTASFPSAAAASAAGGAGPETAGTNPAAASGTAAGQPNTADAAHANAR